VTNKTKSVEEFTEGVDGNITGKGVFYKLTKDMDTETLVIPSATGIYLMEGDKQVGTIKTDKPVTSVAITEDLDGDSKRDIVCIVSSELLPNVRAYSSASGELLWSWSKVGKSYSQIRSWGTDNKTPYSISSTSVGVLVITDYTLDVLDTKTGALKWQYKDQNNIWTAMELGDIDGTGKSSIAVGNQLGEAIALNGEDGKVIWKTKVVPDFNTVNIGKCTRSIWQLSYIKKDGNDKTLIATGEDGRVYELQPNDGKIVATHDVFTLSEDALLNYYASEQISSGYNDRPKINGTNLSDKYFNGLRTEQIADVNGDGIDDVLVVGFLGSYQRNAYFTISEFKRIIEEAKPFIAVYSGKNFEKLWSQNVDMSFNTSEPVLTTDKNGAKVIIIPTKLDNNKLNFQSFDAQDGMKQDDIKIEIPINDGTPINEHLPQNSNTLINSKENKNMAIMLNSDSGQILFGQLNKINTIMLSSDLSKIEFEVDSYLKPVLISPKENEDSFIVAFKNKSSIIKKLKKKDDKSLQKIWELDNVNIITAIATQDLTGDGIIDIICETSNGVMLVNGNDGSKVFDKDIRTQIKAVKIESIDAISIYGDFDKDGFKDIYIMGAIISGKTGEILVLDLTTKMMGNSIWMQIGDVNNDGVLDRLLIRYDRATQYLSTEASAQTLNNIDVNTITFEKGSNEITYNSITNNDKNHFYIQDIDGFPIIGLYDVSDNKFVMNIVSTKDMTSLFKIDSSSEMLPTIFTVEDFNGDGWKDIQLVTGFETKLKLISGKTGDSIWEGKITNRKNYNIYYDINIEKNQSISFGTNGNEERPVGQPFMTGYSQIVKITDITGDGKDDIACTYIDNTGDFQNGSFGISLKEVAFFDLTKSNAEPIKKVLVTWPKLINNGYELFDNDNLTYALSLKTVETTAEDKGKYLIVNFNGVTSMLYDIMNDKFVVSYGNGIMIDYVKYLQNGTLILNNDKMVAIQTNSNLKINELENGSNVSSPYKLKWEKEENSSLSYAILNENNILIANLTDTSQTVNLSKGKSNLIIEAIDENGRITFSNISVNVSKHMLSTYIIYSITVISMISVACFMVLPGIRARKILKEFTKK